MAKPKKQGPPTLTQWRRQIENDYDSKPWQLPIFSYGINTNLVGVQYRCAEWDGTYELALLDHYRMRFSKQYMKNGSTFCNISPHVGDVVEGVLLYLDKKSFKQLDVFEGYPEHYQRELFSVFSVDQDRTIDAWAYISTHTGGGAPSQQYFDGVLAGLESVGCSKGYIEEIREDGKRRMTAKQLRAMNMWI